MAKKRLTDKQVEELKQMVIHGVYPDDIAIHFNIAISSVHNYKNRFKKQGINFPDVIGKKPASAPKPEEVINQENKQELVTYKFTVNGITIEITGEPQKIDIDKNQMDIKF